MSACAACGTVLADGARFCFSCGTPVQAGCTSCGAELPDGARFCPTCGAVQADVPSAVTPLSPVATRRITSVLFGDLVGFTSLSEQRDQEDVRELLSAYFEECSRIVERYGGTVEKFIGDAVMAVWGVPTAHEDDAERAVRAGLELVNRVAAMGADLKAPDLAMRVGIVTGEVAVTIGATQQGMVAGDAVNTAARVQSAATPGQVWVDETTRLLTTAAISYVDVGSHAMKGKADPVPLWAVRAVVAAVGGAQRADGLEAPLVGRDRELRLVKELFHSAEESGHPALLVVEGEAGIGKTRLGWEFEKYADGLQSTVRWHSGRCLAYGEGVAYFALSEAIRGRLQVLRPEGTDAAGDAEEDLGLLLGLGLDAYVPDPEERAWLEPRLGALLGVGAIGTFAREDLFAAWSTFLRRIGNDEDIVVLVVDDAQHADEGLLGFLEYLLGVGGFPCLVVLLARPGLLSANPSLATHRRASVLHIDSLADKDMSALLDGLVAGLPDGVRDALVQRAEGIPLYAVETVRSLIDRDLVVPRGGQYVLADPHLDLDSVGAPASLQALIAARLDALPADERRLLDFASVLGTSFERDVIVELCPEIEDLDTVLASLVRLQLLEQEANRFSSEVGQYQFVQGAVRQVAYGTIARRDRKARHLAVAGLLENDDDAKASSAAVVAHHYLEAIDAVPDAPDVADLATVAVGHLVRAAHRAQALGAPKEAIGHLDAAIGRCTDPRQAAVLESELAPLLMLTQALEESQRRASHAMEALDALGDTVLAARAAAAVASAMAARGTSDAALEIIDERMRAIDGLAGSDEARKRLLESKVTSLIRRGEPADDAAEEFIRVIERTSDNPAEISDGYVGLAIHYAFVGPRSLAVLLFEAAANLAREARDPLRLARVLANLCGETLSEDLRKSSRDGVEALEAARTAGSARWAELAATNHGTAQLFTGDWDELVTRLDESPASEDEPFEVVKVLHRSAIALGRGEPVPPPSKASSDDVDVQLLLHLVGAQARSASEDQDGAGALALAAIRIQIRLVGLMQDMFMFMHVALEALLAAKDEAGMAELLAAVEQADGRRPIAVSASLHRLRANLALARGELDQVETSLRAALDDARSWGSPVLAARCSGELGRFLVDQGRGEEAEPLLAAARAEYERLGAQAWLRELEASVGARDVVR